MMDSYSSRGRPANEPIPSMDDHKLCTVHLEYAYIANI